MLWHSESEVLDATYYTIHPCESISFLENFNEDIKSNLEIKWQGQLLQNNR